MKETSKRVFLTTLLLCSLLFLSLPNLVFAEEKEATTEKVNESNNGAVAEPPSGPNTVIDSEIQGVEIETPASVTGKKFEGTGTVKDFSTSNSKAFFTITDRDQKVFYLIIDLDKTDNNVYFLSDVSKSQLDGSIEPKENVQAAPVLPPIEPEKEDKPKESSDGSFYLMIFLVAGIIVVVYYFRVVKKKKEQGNSTDDDDEMDEDYEEESINFGKDSKDDK